MNKKKITLLALTIITIIAGISGYFLLYSANTQFEEKSKVILIATPMTCDEWMHEFQGEGIVANWSTFSLASKIKRFKTIKPGRYRIKKGTTNNKLINMLRSGDQEAISVSTDKAEDIYGLAGILGKSLQQDSTAFITSFLDTKFQNENGFNAYTMACLFVPNTYEFYWTMKPEEFLKKMKDKYDEYWNSQNLDIAKSMHMTPNEIITLASIVKAETVKKDEAPKIAGLYLNRLKIGMALQSDPTAVFGQKEHSQRVYLTDLENDTPYNTYKYAGLPPGPINFPETIYLEAVLHPSQHDYIYMCAQPGGTGYHNFSKSYDQHLIYRNEYTRYLEKSGIH